MRLNRRGLAACAAWASLGGGSVAASPPTNASVRWVYPERNKWPFIAEAPRDEGFFNSLFQRAARLSGLTPKLDRVPKARAWRQLESGECDFYPGASFSAERSQHVVWIDIGLQTREVCLVRPGLKLTEPLGKSRGLVLGVEPGSSKIDQYSQHRIQHFGSRLTVDKAVEVLARKRADVVVVDIEPLGAYVQRVGKESLSQLGVTVDENCAGPWTPLQLAWSRAALTHEGALSLPAPAEKVGDQSGALPPRCKAALFHAALQRMRTRGELGRLAAKYGIHSPT